MQSDLLNRYGGIATSLVIRLRSSAVTQQEVAYTSSRWSWVWSTVWACRTAV